MAIRIFTQEICISVISPARRRTGENVRFRTSASASTLLWRERRHSSRKWR